MGQARTGPGGQLLRAARSPHKPELPSPDEVEAARKPAGGWKRDQFAAWSLPRPLAQGLEG